MMGQSAQLRIVACEPPFVMYAGERGSSTPLGEPDRLSTKAGCARACMRHSPELFYAARK
jgi:hypothetical protein